MYLAQNFNLPSSHVALSFIPARLTEGAEWYISYYCIYPPTGKLRRKKIKLNRISSVNERREIARKMMMQINQKLDSGWNPFIEEAAPKSFHLFSKCVESSSRGQ